MSSSNSTNLRSYFTTLTILIGICVFLACAIHINFQIGCRSNSGTGTGISHRQENSSLFSSDLLEYVQENLNDLDQANPLLIQYAKIRYLHPPSKKPYNLKIKNSENMKTNLAKWVLKFFGEKRNGTFIEAGAYDGESDSNTLYLEKEMGWTGVLVECNMQWWPSIFSKHRKAWFASVCLAPNSTPGTFDFGLPESLNAATIGKKYLASSVYKPKTFVEVQAMPLYTILAALDWKEIDFFNFDIEGVELALARSFPFDKVIFKLIIVEIQYYTSEQKKEMRGIFEANNYIFVKDVVPSGIDHIYVHQSVKDLIPNLKGGL